MTILAIDTSNYPLGIALVKEEDVIAERITYIKKNHSVRMMPALEELMKECDITPKDLTKIVVSEGPGSYTGTRIGVTIAKTLAWSLQIPLVGVSSLKAIAAGVGRYSDYLIAPLIDARRGAVYTGLYKYDDNQLLNVISDQYVDLTSWLTELEALSKEIIFVGNDLKIHQELIKNSLKNKASFAFATENNPRPSELAFLSKSEEQSEVHSFTPNYLRIAEAEANWLRSQND